MNNGVAPVLIQGMKEWLKANPDAMENKKKKKRKEKKEGARHERSD